MAVVTPPEPLAPTINIEVDREDENQDQGSEASSDEPTTSHSMTVDKDTWSAIVEDVPSEPSATALRATRSDDTLFCTAREQKKRQEQRKKQHRAFSLSAGLLMPGLIQVPPPQSERPKLVRTMSSVPCLSHMNLQPLSSYTPSSDPMPPGCSWLDNWRRGHGLSELQPIPTSVLT